MWLDTKLMSIFGGVKLSCVEGDIKFNLCEIKKISCIMNLREDWLKSIKIW